MKELLDVQNLKTYFFTSYGVVKAVDNINMKVDERESIGVVGESGCGKTMTAMSIMRLIPPPGKIVDGKIFFKGRNLMELTEEKMRRVRGKEISMVFQDPNTYLNPVMTVQNQIAEAIKLHQQIKNSEIKEKVISLLRLVGVPSPERVISYYPHQMSGGMLQRVMISIALSCNSSLIIADEPTTALDVTIQAQILDLLKELRNKLGTSILLITHDLGVVAELCDRMYLMYAGKVVEHGDVIEIFENPKHPYALGLLESTKSISGFKKVLLTLDGVVPDLVNPPSGCRFHPRCRQARVICMKKEPPSIEIESGHAVSCWLFSGRDNENSG